MLDKGALKAALEAGFRNVTPGEDSVSSLVSAMADAIEVYVKSGKVTVNSTTGMCTASGAHPALTSEGSIT